ncbi:band 4.1-like protein 4 isoform X2 [Dermacentor variabilis]|uniref:band 4.1-like protein 4 isoform X2 n=1 Tax=Dermacentor variabilis TaxID=34621 RepID=UPI003F5AE62C
MRCCFGEKPKTFHCKVVLLDETELIQEIQNTSRGQDLLDVVHKHLNLLETAYFGLRFVDTLAQTHWLDPNKKIHRQVKGMQTFTFYFGVKFYTPDPCKLLEEITRYQYFLQVKQDIYHGRLPISFDLAAELFALAIQSELGDYDPRRHQPGYSSELRFLVNQTPELEEKVAELHKGLRGQVPAVAEMNFLDKVKWLDMYGVDLHPVIGEDHTEYFLGLTPSGVVVLRNKTKVSNYYWPRITKVHHKGCYFMLQVRDKANDDSTYGFELATKQACKHLWRCCVDHHSFFRLTQTSENPIAPKYFGWGGKLRVSTRRERPNPASFKIQPRQQPAFVRVPSRRYQRRLGQPDGADGTQLREQEKHVTDHRNGSHWAHSALLSPSSTSLHHSSPVPATSTPVTPGNQSSSVPPWEDPKQRGLYSSSTNPSPRSVRSSGSRHSHCRSSSNEGDCRRRKHHSRRGSDNESEVSRSSRGSRGSKCSRASSGGCRHSCHSRDSGSESDHHHHHRHKHRHQRRHRSYELIDSEAQWKEVQKLQQASVLKQPQSAVVRDLSARKSGYIQSGMETESEAQYAQRKKHRRHRSRSKSPDVKRSIPNDVKKHIEYHLIDPVTLTEEEKKDIKYTKVETDSRLFKIRYSPTAGRPNYRMAKISSSRAAKENKNGQEEEDGPPPPYSTLHSSPAAHVAGATSIKIPLDFPSASGPYESSPKLTRDTFPRPLMTPVSMSNGSPLINSGMAVRAPASNGKLPVFTSRASSTSNLLAPTTTVSSCMTTLANGGISYKSFTESHFWLQESPQAAMNESPRLTSLAPHLMASTRFGSSEEETASASHEPLPAVTSSGPRVTFQTPTVATYSRVYSSPPWNAWSPKASAGDTIPKSPLSGCHEMSTEL